jgi:putative IMPACT (imprinted ancient) family translation regulator
MTPKEKAKELVEKMSYNDFDEDHNCSHYVAKNCALIAVDEMIKELEELLEGDERPSVGVYYLWEYYKEVKQEIELL